MENLKIPDKYRRTGLYIYCNKCKCYSNINTGRLKKSSNCNHPPEKQVYKLKAHFPGTKNMSRSLVINTRDIKEVDKLRLEFFEFLKSNNYNNSRLPSPKEIAVDKFLLVYQMKRYMDYITNGGFYEYEDGRKLTISTIKDYRRNFKYFFESIKDSVDIKTIRVDQIQMGHINLFPLLSETLKNKSA